MQKIKSLPEKSVSKSSATFSKKRTFLYALFLTALTPFIFNLDFFDVSTHYFFTIFDPVIISGTNGVHLLLFWYVFILTASDIYLLLFAKIVIFFFIIRFLDIKVGLSKRNFVYVLIVILLLAHALLYSISLFNHDLMHNRAVKTLEKKILKDIKVGMSASEVEFYLAKTNVRWPKRHPEHPKRDLIYDKRTLVKLVDGTYVSKDFYDEYCREVNKIDEEHLKKNRIEYYVLSYDLPYIYFKNGKVVAVTNEWYDDHVCKDGKRTKIMYGIDYINQLFD